MKCPICGEEIATGGCPNAWKPSHVPNGYTQEMRAKNQACPKCGFWHTTADCPPQYNPLPTMFLEQRVVMLEQEVEELKRELRSLEKFY